MRFFACMICASVLVPVMAGAEDLPLDKIKLPAGFHIALYNKEVPGARSMALSDKGTLFVGSRTSDHLVALKDKDGDGTPETIYPIGKDLNQPNGVAVRNGALYVAEMSRIIRYDAIDENLENPPAPAVVLEGLPTEPMHSWKYLAVGPDDYLYFNIGSLCNSCSLEGLDERFATIDRVKLDGTGFEIFARGVRQSVGFDWHPLTKDLWFSDNGRDNLGDDRPSCELNRATKAGLHFGFPYCAQGDDPDPELGKERGCEGFEPPVEKLGAHVTPLGLKFNTGNQFPAEYKNALFVAEHGSFNRTIPSGYQVVVVRTDAQGNSKGAEVFAEGWVHRTQAWGRPVDVLFLPDGSMLVSDDKAGVIYRITYSGK